jgi:YVTN family beta-propeller protein
VVATGQAGDKVVRIDPKKQQSRRRSRSSGRLLHVDFGEGAIWVTSTKTSVVIRIDPKSNKVTDTFPVGPQPRFQTVGEGFVWTLNQGDGTVSKIDPKTRKVVATIPVGFPAGAVNFGRRRRGMDYRFPDSDLRIDPKTDKVTHQYAGRAGTQFSTPTVLFGFRTSANRTSGESILQKSSSNDRNHSLGRGAARRSVLVAHPGSRDGHSLTDLEGGANVSSLFYNANQTDERYNMPDTLKAQHIARLTKGFVLYSDMGRILCSITDDTVGWHDPIGGTLNRTHVLQKFGEKSYQEFRNDWTQSAREGLLLELAKYSLGPAI